jgi:hypothetical protein
LQIAQAPQQVWESAGPAASVRWDPHVAGRMLAAVGPSASVHECPGMHDAGRSTPFFSSQASKP